MTESAAPYRTRSRLSPQELEARLADLSLVVFDVDGTLTDGRIGYVGAERALFFHTHDGHGIRTLIETGAALVGWCTTNRTMCIRERAKALKVTFLMQGCDGVEERPTKKQAIENLGIPWNKIAYCGDDLIDLPAMLESAVIAAPANALPEVIGVADWVSRHVGGFGAAREFCNLILQAKGYEPRLNTEKGIVEWRQWPNRVASTMPVR